MLFSQDKNKKDQAKKQSTLGFFFNPRLGRDLAPVGESLHMFAYMIATILANNGLFPKDHPIFENTAIHLSLRQIIATAWSRLSFTKEGAPKVALFFAVIGCLIFSALFVVTFIAALFIAPAHAADTSSMFTAPANDYATNWIDFIFLGKTINTIDGTTSNVATGCSFQAGLSALLGFYSTGMLVLGGFILLYHLTSMIVNTAHTGKFMGEANQVWAPIRLVFAIGLLIPLSGSPSSSCSISGYNTGQYLVMRVAKLGSALASKGWETFLNASSYADGDANCTSGSPSCIRPSPEASIIVKSMAMNYACMAIYNKYITDAFSGISSNGGKTESRYLAVEKTVKNVDTYASKTYFQPAAPSLPGLCGGYAIPKTPGGVYASSYTAQINIFKEHISTFKSLGNRLAAKAIDGTIKDKDETLSADLYKEMQSFQSALKKGVTAAIASGDQAITTRNTDDRKSYTEYGWLTAGAWFNTIARMQTERSNSVQNGLPSPLTPKLPGATKKEKEGGTKSVNQKSFALIQLVSNYLSLPETAPEAAATAEVDFRLSEIDDSFNLVDYSLKLVDRMGGWYGLWDSEGDLAIKFGKTTNPLGEIAAFGQNNVRMGAGLLSWAAAANIGAKVLDGENGGVIGGILGFASGGLGTAVLAAISGALGALSALLTVMAGLFFTAGFAIGFLVPLFPFFRFFFGSVTWLLNILGAVVGAPLFALAHLNPTGAGLPGPQAKNGYFYLTQIFLRPTLMVLGLIAGFLVFSASIAFLNAFFLIVAKGTGAYSGSIPTIAKLVYSFLYCGMVYMLCNTCFKTIGFFPQTAMQWFGGASQQEERVGDPGQIGAALTYVSGNIMQKMLPNVVHAPGKLLDAKKKRDAHHTALHEKEKAAQIAGTRHDEDMMSRGFSRQVETDEGGNPVMDSKGAPKTSYQPDPDLMQKLGITPPNKSSSSNNNAGGSGNNNKGGGPGGNLGGGGTTT